MDSHKCLVLLLYASLLVSLQLTPFLCDYTEANRKSNSYKTIIFQVNQVILLVFFTLKDSEQALKHLERYTHEHQQIILYINWIWDMVGIMGKSGYYIYNQNLLLFFLFPHYSWRTWPVTQELDWISSEHMAKIYWSEGSVYRETLWGRSRWKNPSCTEWGLSEDKDLHEIGACSFNYSKKRWTHQFQAKVSRDEKAHQWDRKSVV